MSKILRGRPSQATAPSRTDTASLRKPASGVVAASSDDHDNDNPILPEPVGAAKSNKRQPIDIARAVANCASLPVLEITKRRLYRDWLNGRDLAVLQVMYRDPVFGIPPRKANGRAA